MPGLKLPPEAVAAGAEAAYDAAQKRQGYSSRWKDLDADGRAAIERDMYAGITAFLRRWL